MYDFTMTIAGRSVAALDSFEIDNPATGEAFTSAPECSAEQLDDAMTAAQDAFEEWRRDPSARRSVLEGAADLVESHADELAGIITTEQGKPLSEAQEEVEGAASDLRYYPSLQLPEDSLHDDGELSVVVQRRAIGPVATITPWNYPLGVAVAKVATALAAGCTVVLKPSPYTPLSCLRFGEIVRDAFPPGVLNVISGGDRLGAELSRHPLTRLVSFTGSIETGKQIAAAAAGDLKRIELELGGNDPAVVLDDVDVDLIADDLFAYAFGNCGQVCDAIKRVYAPQRIYGQLVDALADRARAARVGDGGDANTQIGPLTNAMQRDRVSELVRDAVSNGGRVAAGGKAPDRPGYFWEPTVLADVAGGERIVVEEQFGPALPVVPYDDLSEAVHRANDTQFGLCASVWSGDAERGAAVASQLQAGTIWVNTHQGYVDGQPSSGLKWSGVGAEGGLYGLLGFTSPQVVHVVKSAGR
ncbi:MAG: aldehyde dehydrogenase family protein [Pseudonocardiales bacterium]